MLTKIWHLFGLVWGWLHTKPGALVGIGFWSGLLVAMFIFAVLTAAERDPDLFERGLRVVRRTARAVKRVALIALLALIFLALGAAVAGL